MKAIRVHQFGGPEVLRLEEIPTPVPGPKQVLLEAKAIGVNPVDTYIRAGLYGDRPFPFVPGMDAAGVVEAVGNEVTAYTPGDRVYYYGVQAYSEKILSDLSQVFPLPAEVTFEQGAALGVPYATAYYALFNRGGAQPGEWVLIHGASGGVGIAGVQLARAKGLQVIGTAGTPKGLELVKKEGAHIVLNHTASDYLDQLMKLTEGRGVNLIIEMAAHLNLGKDLKVLAVRGRVVVVGSRGKVEIDPRDTMGRLADIRGLSLLYTTPEERAGIHKSLQDGLMNGSLRPVIGEKLPLAQAAEAHRKVMEPGAFGKIVLIP